MNPTKQEIAAVGCRLCEKGFPTQEGVHYGTQSLGMIPATLCENASGEEVAEWIVEQIDNGLCRADIKQQIECAIEWAERRSAALAAASSVSQWQPIENAPKDGTEVLLTWLPPEPPNEPPCVILAGWICRAHEYKAFARDCPNEVDCDMGWGRYAGEITDWQPLPALPIKEKP